MTGAVAVAAASVLLGGVIARAADLGPAPAPVADTLAAAQAPAPDPWAALPMTPLAPAAPNSRPQDTATTAAPPGGATASVIQVNPIDTCISCTSANARSDSGTARATAVRLLGNDVSGGRSEGGPSSGALLAVPASPLLTLAIADWATSASSGTAHSRAALADLVVGPSGHHSGGVLSVAVLEATSDAGYHGLGSEGNGENNGVDLNVGDGALVVLLLHSDASSKNSGSAYVAGINGTRVLGSEQTGAAGIPIAVPGVVGLILLQVNASGGAGSAGVGTVSDLLGQSGQAAGVLTASAVGVPDTGAPAGGIATGTTTPSTGGGLGAPNTGMALGLSGLLILPAGLALLFLALRRRRGSAG
jgi:hypothetical protein